jgi:hypothetical protein
VRFVIVVVMRYRCSLMISQKYYLIVSCRYVVYLPFIRLKRELIVFFSVPVFSLSMFVPKNQFVSIHPDLST